jgi:hypothetical protein
MLFDYNLTPQVRHLLVGVRRGIREQTLRTSDLNHCLLRFREADVSDEIWELGSAIAHSKRDRGPTWTRVLTVWATHMYFEYLGANEPRLSPLPVDIYNAILGCIRTTDGMQLARDMRIPKRLLKNSFSGEKTYGFPKKSEGRFSIKWLVQRPDTDEMLATIERLYSPGKSPQHSGKQDGFVHLVSGGGHIEEDLELVRRLVRYCEPMALSIPSVPMEETVEAIDKAFRAVGVGHGSFTRKERNYLQLHLLVSFHHMSFEIEASMFKAMTGQVLPNAQPRLTVITTEPTLAMGVAFVYKERCHLETLGIRDPDLPGRSERYYYPLLSSDLDTSEYLLESDDNIRACLFNHPLEVKKHKGKAVLVALERDSAWYKATRSGEDD